MSLNTISFGFAYFKPSCIDSHCTKSSALCLSFCIMCWGLNHVVTCTLRSCISLLRNIPLCPDVSCAWTTTCPSVLCWVHVWAASGPLLSQTKLVGVSHPRPQVHRGRDFSRVYTRENRYPAQLYNMCLFVFLGNAKETFQNGCINLYSC